MDYISRIDAYLLKPLAIQGLFGLNQYLAFLQSTELSAKGSNLPAQVYKRTIKENRPVLYSVQSGEPTLNVIDGKIESTEQQTIAQVNLKGTMLAEGGLCTYGIDHTCKQISKAAANPNIMGILLNTHSGGGEVVAAQRLSNAVEEARRMKPVVQYVDGMAASGAYWVGVHCDEIVLGGKTTEVGSIGVVIQMDKQILEDLRENLISIFADGSEQKQDVFKAILEGNFDFVKTKALNPIRKEFVNVVKRGRAGVIEEAFTGTMFQGNQAKKAGLVDSIGLKSDALRRIVTLSRRKNRISSAKKALAYG